MARTEREDQDKSMRLIENFTHSDDSFSPDPHAFLRRKGAGSLRNPRPSSIAIERLMRTAGDAVSNNILRTSELPEGETMRAEMIVWGAKKGVTYSSDDSLSEPVRSITPDVVAANEGTAAT